MLPLPATIAGLHSARRAALADFQDEDPTRPIEHMTIAEVAERSNGGRVEIAFSDRPTRDMRNPNRRK